MPHRNIRLCMYVYVVYNKVRELVSVKVLHTLLLNTTVFAFKVLSLGSYALMPAPSPPFKIILELILWNGLQICCFISPNVIDVIKMPSFQLNNFGTDFVEWPSDLLFY